MRDRAIRSVRWCVWMNFENNSSARPAKFCRRSPASRSVRIMSVRHGMCSVFMAYSPLESWREVRVTGQRTARDYAQTLRWLCD